MLDDSNKFYLANLQTKKINCIQNQLNFDCNEVKAFRLFSSNNQEQFLFSDRCWLNGYKLSEHDDLEANCRKSLINIQKEPFACVFYTQKRNELFIIGWKES